MKRTSYIRQAVTAPIISASSLLFVATSQNSQGAITVTIEEIGGNIVISHSTGSLDTTGLDNLGAAGGTATFLSHENGGFIGGGLANDGVIFSGGVITVTQSGGWSFGTVSIPFDMTIGAGGLFGAKSFILEDVPNIIIVDDAQGSAIVGVNDIEAFSGTVVGASFDSVGLTADEFITFDLGNGDSLTFTTVALPAVPEPSSSLLLGLAGLGLLRRRR